MVTICSLCVGIVFVCSADAFLMESSTTLSKHFFQKFSFLCILIWWIQTWQIKQLTVISNIFNFLHQWTLFTWVLNLKCKYMCSHLCLRWRYLAQLTLKNKLRRYSYCQWCAVGHGLHSHKVCPQKRGYQLNCSVRPIRFRSKIILQQVIPHHY